MSTPTETVRVRRSRTGAVTVTVTLKDGPHMVAWSVVAFTPSSTIKAATDEARDYASTVLAELAG